MRAASASCAEPPASAARSAASCCAARPITDLGTQALKLGVFLTVALAIATLRFGKRLD